MTSLSPLNLMLIDDVINRTLAEDLGRAGDITRSEEHPSELQSH